MDSSENIILLSLEDHQKAHQLLFEIYRDVRDKGAVNLLTGRCSKAIKL